MTRTRPQRAGYVEPVAVCTVCGRERRCRGARAGTPVCHTCRRKRRPEVGAAGPGVLGVRADPAVLLRAHRAPDVPLLRRAPRVAPRAMRVLRQGRDRRRAHPRRRGMRHLPGTADVAPSSPASAASRPHDHPPGTPECASGAPASGSRRSAPSAAPRSSTTRWAGAPPARSKRSSKSSPRPATRSLSPHSAAIWPRWPRAPSRSRR